MERCSDGVEEQGEPKKRLLVCLFVMGWMPKEKHQRQFYKPSAVRASERLSFQRATSDLQPQAWECVVCDQTLQCSLCSIATRFERGATRGLHRKASVAGDERH